jgi:hypothetical protein
MEERGALLEGIARVLNAGGSALLNLYDAATSIKISALSGEKVKLKGNIRAYEKKIERLYYEIGKEVSRHGDATQISAAGEAGVKLVVEYRAEIEIAKQRIEEIEVAERLERQRLLEEREAASRMKRQQTEKQAKIASEKAAPRREVERKAEEEIYVAKSEPVVVAEPSWPEVPFASEASTGATSAVIPADAGIQKPDWMPDHDAEYPVAEAGAQEIGTETAASAEPEAGEELPGVEIEEKKGAVAEPSEAEKEEPHKYTAEELGNMLKADLLALCTEKGIEADRRMTKAQIIELILAC